MSPGAYIWYAFLILRTLSHSKEDAPEGLPLKT
jgi:hypothetical protein